MQASSVVLTVHGQLKQWILRIFLSNIRHVKHIYAYGFYCSKFSGDLLRQKPQKRLRHSFASCVLSSAALYMHWINELLIKVVYTTEMERETASIFSLLSCLSDCSCFRLQEVQPVSGLFWSFQCTGDVPDWLIQKRTPDGQRIPTELYSRCVLLPILYSTEGPEFIFVASAFSSSFKFSETTSFLLLVLFCLWGMIW